MYKQASEHQGKEHTDACTAKKKKATGFWALDKCRLGVHGL
jgi:hypothetical protein